MKSILEQLLEIYYNEEFWHDFKMSFEKALSYHRDELDNGSIHTYSENGELLGYYQRHFKGDECILYNVWVKRNHRYGKVFRELYRHFFKTMPKEIKYVTGEKVKLGKKFQKVLITKERRNGKH